MVHEGNTYFETCYGADFNPKLDDTQREACWNAWLAHYTRHQPAHRIDYAMRRVEALTAGEPPLTLPGITPGAPIPTPPEDDGLVLLEGVYAGAEAETRLDDDAQPAGVPHGCEGACTALEQACLARCTEGAVACRDACTQDRALCLGGCY